jgi:hypothetical protein
LEGRISILPLNKGNKLKEGSRRFTKEEEFVCFFRNKKEKNEYEREELILMCERMFFMEKKKLCANKEHGRKLCVGSSCSGIHGRISMNKPLDSCLK